MSVWNKNYFSFVPGFVHTHGGFTLLEVMIAISLLAISLTTLFGSQSQSVSLGSTTKFNTQAPFLAQQKLAEYTRTPDRPTSDSGDFGDKFPGYQWKIEAEDANLEASKILSKLEDTFQRVTLTVSWGDSHYVYQVQSYLFKDTVR
jgi:general secretion pathway protein I